MNIKNCGSRNVRKHIEIKDSEKYINLEISLKFGSMDKMIITSSEPKYYLRRSGKGLITSLVLNSRASLNKYKKSRYAITNVSMKDISKIIRESEKLPYKGYVSKRPKHEPTDSYFYLSRQIEKCMVRSYALNSYNDPAIIEMTGTKQIPISHVFSSDESKSKYFLYL